MQSIPDHELLQKVNREVSQCDRCGTCLPVCPLFGVRDIESSSARGKNAIARALTDGGIGPTPDVLAAVDFCLLCRACVEACPNGIATDEAMIDVRQYLVARTGGRESRYRAAAAILKSRALVKLAARALALSRRFGLNGLFPHGMVPEEWTRAQYLAAFAGPAAFGRPAPFSGAAEAAAETVAYFQGCGMRMMFPEAADQTRRILETKARLISRDNVCCGLPHLAHGMRGDFLKLAKENIALYEDVPVIVSDCASCSGMLKRTAVQFADDHAWRERAAAFSRKVVDITEYLGMVGYRPRRHLDVTFTYHDPCHLARGQGIRRPPRDLLKQAGTFVEMEGADICCGGAGSFHVDYPEIAARILDRKREHIEQTGASVVVTGCPGCLIQMTKAAKDSGGKFKALHISQVI